MITPDTFPQEGMTEYADIESFVDAYGVSGKYKCSVHQWDDATSDWAFCKTFNSKVPTPEEVARFFGPALTRWTFIREEPDPVTGKRQPKLEYKMQLKGPHWEQLHQEYKEQMEAERFKKLREKLEKQRVESMYMGGLSGMTPQDPQAAQDSLLKTIGAVKGLMPQQGDGMLIAVMKMISDQAAQQQQNSQNFMQIMMTAMNNQTQMTMGMMTALLNGNRDKNDPMEMMKMTTGIVRDFVQLKAEATASPAEPDRLGEILDFAKEVLPAAFQMLSKTPKPFRRVAVQKVVKGNPMFAELKDNPELLAGALNEWDKVYGPEQMDEMLRCAGLSRPASTAGNYAAYGKSAAGSQDTAAGAGDAQPLDDQNVAGNGPGDGQDGGSVEDANVADATTAVEGAA